jgi:hypothetical protein
MLAAEPVDVPTAATPMVWVPGGRANEVVIEKVPAAFVSPPLLSTDTLRYPCVALGNAVRTLSTKMATSIVENPVVVVLFVMRPPSQEIMVTALLGTVMVTGKPDRKTKPAFVVVTAPVPR